MPGVSVAKGAMLCAQGVATHDIEQNTVAGGVPARKIKTTTEAHRFEDRTGEGPCVELPPND
jgi:acetyltransferase-like isoleucine patch superfamily enzyme